LDDRNRRLEENSTKVEQFLTYCLDKKIHITKDDIDFLHTIGLYVYGDKITERLISDVKKDKDNLYSIKELYEKVGAKKIQDGFFDTGDFILIADSSFRRGFHENSNFAPHFISIFWKIEDPKLDLYISLDSNRVRIDDGSAGYFEADTWYGAAFERDIIHIQDGLVKLTAPMDIKPEYLSFLFNNVLALDVKWSSKGQIKTFQAIEFLSDNVTVNRMGQELHPARYIHAEFDLQSKKITHFDGAIQYFTKSEYLERRYSDFNHDQKSKNQLKGVYKKIFKINGAIDIEPWVELTSHFFTGNPLIIEYFSGEVDSHTLEVLEKIRNIET